MVALSCGALLRYHASEGEPRRSTPGVHGPYLGACAPPPLCHVPSRTRKKVFMSPTAEHIHDATATFGECQRLVHSGRKQAGIQYLMHRWRAIPAELHTRFLHDEFLTLPVDTQARITDLLLVRSREAGIAERTAALRHQMRADREQTVRLDAVAAGITAAYRTRWHRWGGLAALCALAALLTLLSSTF